MSEFYKTYVKLCAEAKKSLTKAAVEAGLSNAAPSGWKAGKEISDISLQKLANYFTEQLHRSITVSDLLDSKSSSGEVPDDIKNLAAAFSLVKKQQDYKNPAVKKIIEICNEHPDAVEDILLFAEALKRRSEKK